MKLYRRLLAAALAPAVLATGVLLSASPASAYTTTLTTTDPGKTLVHDWSPGVAIENGVANSCYFASSSVSGRQHVCRVIDGYEQTGDNRNWKVDFTASEAPFKRDGTSTGTYGQGIVLNTGAVLEGCSWTQSTNIYICDYRMRKPIVLSTSGNAYKYVLRKFWNWQGYAANAVGCAGGMLLVWRKVGVVSWPLLNDCADGPL